MEPPEIVDVEADADSVMCDGGQFFGHPMVYLTLGGEDSVDCYYCGRRFVRAAPEREDTDAA